MFHKIVYQSPVGVVPGYGYFYGLGTSFAKDDPDSHRVVDRARRTSPGDATEEGMAPGTANLFGEVFGLRAELRTEVESFDRHAENVLEHKVGFLNVHRDTGRDDHIYISDLRHRSAAIARKRNRMKPHSLSQSESLHTIPAIA